MKRLLYLISFLTLLLALFCLTASADASGTCGADGDNLTWEWLNQTGELIISGSGEMENFPNSSDAPWSGYYFTTVQIEDGVTSIGDYAFAYEEYLEEVAISNSVTTIGTSAFENCTNLYSLSLGSGLATVGDLAFYSCDLSSLKLPSSLTTIGCSAFSNCGSLYSLTIPSSVTSIGESAFGYCGLTKISVSNSNQSYCAVDGILFSKDQKTLHTYPNGATQEQYQIPDGVVYIAAGAFGGTESLTSITIPDSVTHIGSTAFSDCTSLPALEIPDSVTSIDSYAFSGCTSLTALEIPDGVTSISNGVFSNCDRLTSLEIPDGVASIGDYAFSGCDRLTTMEIPDQVTSIGYRAFYNCLNLTKLTLGSNVTTIGNWSFSGCESLTEIIIPDSTTSIGNYTFSDCIALKTAQIGESVTSIDDNAFYHCDTLTAIKIPAGIMSIGEYAFRYCSFLTDVYYYGTSEQWSAIAMESGNTYLTTANRHYMAPTYISIGDNEHTAQDTCTDCGVTFGEAITMACVDDDSNKLCDLCGGKVIKPLASGYCGGEGDGTNLTWKLTDDGIMTISGTGSMADYSYDTIPWDSYNNYIQSLIVGDGVTSIGTNTFRYAPLSEITLPNTVQSIGDYAFQGCNMKSIELPKGVSQLGGRAFGTSELEEITVDPQNPYLCSEDGVLFNNDKTTLICYPSGKSDTSYTIPDTVQTIGEGAFYFFDFTSVTIPDSVKTIEDSAFGYGDLYRIVIPDSVETIGYNTFTSCDAYDIKIGNGVVSIGEWAFSANPVSRLTIGCNVETIGNNAFAECYSLQTMYVYADYPDIGRDAFWDSYYIDDIYIYEGADWITAGVFARPEKHYMKTVYTPGTDEAHTITLACSDCGVTLGEAASSDCVDEDRDYACDLCGGDVGILASGHCGSEGDGTNLTWKLSEDYILMISGTGAMQNYNSSTAPWYSYRSSIKTVQIGDKVTTIGNRAFRFLSVLPSMDIPTGITTIGEIAFSGCDRLTAVKIPASVTTIGESAFSCQNLVSIEVAKENTAYTSQNGILYTKDLKILVAYPAGKQDTHFTIPDSVTTIDHSAFADSNLTTVEIPDSVTTIGESAFYRCTALTAVELPDSVTAIGNRAFYCCFTLAKADIGNGVASIGVRAFCSCDALTTVVLGGGVKTIGSNAFTASDALSNVYYYGTSERWSSLSIGSGNANLTDATRHYMAPAYAASGNETHTLADTCSDCGVTLGEAVSSDCVDEDRNYACDLCGGDVGILASGYCGGEGDGTNLIWKLRDNGTLLLSGSGKMKDYNYNTMPWYSYRHSIKTVQIGNGVTQIGRCSFDGCDALTTVEIPDSVTVIGDYAFDNCDRLAAVEIPDSVITIEHNAFYDCDALITIEIPNSVTAIGHWAFSGCGSLTAIEVAEANQFYVSVDGVLYTKDMTTLVACPAGKQDTIAIADSVTTIGFHAFDGCDALTAVEIPDGVTTIDDGAFYSCNALTIAQFPNSVTAIGDQAFYNCEELTDVYYYGTSEQWNSVSVGSSNEDLTNATLHYITAAYTSNGNKTHTAQNTCSDCGITLGEAVTSACTNGDEDYACDLCGGNVCEHLSAPNLEYTSNDDNTSHCVLISCFDCGKQVSQIVKEHCTFADNVCMMCGAELKQFSIAGANMTLGNDLKMNIMIKNADMEEGYTVRVSQPGKEPVTLTPTRYNSSYQYVAYPIAAKEMTDVLTVEVYNAAGHLVSKPFTRTAVQYSLSLLNASTSSNALKSVIVDMLNYGTEAQKYFGYNETAYANANVTAEQQTLYATGDVQCTNIRELNGNAYATNLSLEASILMNAFFRSTTTEGMSATISFVNHKGKEVTAEADVVKHSSSLVKVVVDEIVLADAKRPVTITVYKDGALYGTCTESVESYVARNLNNAATGAINIAIIKFATSAYTYLGGTN